MAEITLALDGDFAEVINTEAKKVVKKTEAQMLVELQAAGEGAAKELREKSAYRKHRGKHYRTGWKCSTVKPIAGFGASVTVHNTTKPQISHLLEKGHAKVNGGRVEGDGLIKKTYQKYAKKLLAMR